MEPGTRWHYVERGGGEVSRVTTTVTRRTKVIGGIRARVIHDVVRLRGQVVEDTLDWYAQDSGGSIWYLGEATKEYEIGHLVSTKGSWQHGVDGGQAGVIVPAAPGVGCVYREEYHAPDAKDRARVLSTSEGIKGPTGYYRRTLHTANTTPVQPRAAGEQVLRPRRRPDPGARPLPDAGLGRAGAGHPPVAGPAQRSPTSLRAASSASSAAWATNGSSGSTPSSYSKSQVSGRASRWARGGRSPGRRAGRGRRRAAAGRPRR